MNLSVNTKIWPARPNRPWRILFCGLGLLCLLLASGCSPIIRADQPSGVPDQTLAQGQSTGQSFTARFAGLASIYIFLEPGAPGDGQITFHLQSNPNHLTNPDRAAQEDLRKAILPVGAINAPNFYKFDFPPLSDSQFQDYYAYLEITGEGQVLVASGPAETYLEGAFYQNHQPLEAQAAFRLGYDAWLMAAGLLRMGFDWLLLLLVGAFLFLLPGWGLLSALYAGWKELSWPGKTGLAAGVSLALYPLLLLWAKLVRLQPAALLAWLPPLLGLGLLLWRIGAQLNTRRQRPSTTRSSRAQTGGFQTRRSQLKFSWTHLAFLAVAVLVTWTRLWPVRGLEMPMLGDSYQHSMITQLLLDNGGLFDSWQPYAELSSFTYHFGFHAAAAAFAWVTRLPAPQAVLWTGQILNILAVLSLYPLAAKVGRNPWAGVAAVVLAGLLAPMPMSYVNWGRYTQLAGQAALPAAVYLLWEVLENKAGGRAGYWLSWVVLAGMALLHYRVLIFALIFLPAWLILSARETGLATFARRVFVIGSGSLILFLPWLAHVYGGAIMGMFTTNLGTPAAQVTEATQQYNAVGDLTAYLPLWTWLLLPLALAWSLWRREKGTVLTGLWWGLVILFTNPHWLGLPGTGSISNFAVAIAAYIPAAILLGGVLGNWLNRLERAPLHKFAKAELLAKQGLPQALFFVLALVVSLAGARQTITYVNVPEHALVTRPDLRAAAWIQENTPTEARFLVNSLRAYGGSVVAGSDAGWWLPLLAKRQTTLPPLSYGLEVEPWPGYRKYVRQVTQLIEQGGVLHPDSLAALAERGVSHVYVGQQQGRVNYNGPAVLDPNLLLSSEHFKLVYRQDRVWIFEFNP